MMKLSKVFSHWDQLRADLIATLEKFSDEELSHIPFEGAWSIGQIVRHILNAEEGWLWYVATRKLTEWPAGLTHEKYGTVASLKAKLSSGHTQTMAYLETLEIEDFDRVIKAPWGKDLTLGWILWHVIEHEIHHRGELSLILGLLRREGLDV